MKEPTTSIPRGAPDAGPEADRVPASREYELLLLGTFGNGGVGRYVEQQADWLGDVVDLAVYDMVTPPTTGSTRAFLLGLVSMIWAVVRFPFRRPPDVVHVHSSHWYSFYRASPYVLFAAYVWRRPVVLHVHGSSFDEFVGTESRPVQWLQSLVFDAVDGIVVLSEYWRTVVERRADPEKLHVLPNAVEPAAYQPREAAEPPRVVYVSSLLERKGVEELLAAVDSLDRRSDVDYRLSIAGDGPLADAVERVASDRPHVEYLGYVPTEQKRSLLEAGSVYVLPTRAEGLPIAMLEGMAGGCAVVSTPVGAIPEVIDEGDGGILVSPGDPEALAEALATLVSSPERTRRMGRHNRELIEQRYAWSDARDRLLALYDDLYEPTPGS